MALADVDFIDGDLLELVQLGLAEAALEVLGLDLLDGVPTDHQMVGDILDGHVPGQFQGIAFEGTGVVLLGVGEGDFDLADLAAVEAANARHLEFDEGGLVADGQRAKGAFDAALGPDRRRSRSASSAGVRGAVRCGRWSCPASKVLADIAVADEAEAVIQ